MNETTMKRVIEGVTLVTTMMKLVVQHRGQTRKGKCDVSNNKKQ